MAYLAFDKLPEPGDKFVFEEEIQFGYCSKVYRAHDTEKDRKVVIKIQVYDRERIINIEEEYHILRDYSTHPNLPDLYGVYRKKKGTEPDEVWFILEYCDGGTAVELVNKLLNKERRMKEEHIAFILHQVAKAVCELNRNHFIHRDVRGSNILLTKNGEVKICDFGLTREVDSTMGKRGTCIGSPCWMSPEVVMSQEAREKECYDSRTDVWALGITAIELGDGKPPFADMHPTRAMFQIVRNPPPTLFKPSNWSQNYNDFITECLEKNPENRPVMMEVVEHPFLTELPGDEQTMQQEIKQLIDSVQLEQYFRPEEILIDRGYIKRANAEPEKLYTEDLAAIEDAVDQMVLETLRERLNHGQSYSFIGDILLSLNSNDLQKEYSPEFHAKYKFKSRSENAPHIFSVADLAYQDMMHHKIPQHVTFAGESYSGKTTNVRLFIDHLCFLGGGNKGATERVLHGLKAVGSLTHAGTPLNNDSTRCSLQYHITFGSTGKLSGAIFIMQLLEKMRVSTTDMNQHNYHIFYYFYDYMEATGKLNEYHLDSGRKYRYLRIPQEKHESKIKYVRDDPEGNVKKYEEFEATLTELDISRKHIETMRKTLAAILNIGDLRYRQNEKRFAEIEDAEYVTRAADLLRLDEKKFQWSLVNYCKVKGGIAERRQYTAEQARDSRDALAATIYQRLADWVINKINMNLAFPRAVFGDMNVIVIYDMFGFECFVRNGLEQLMINTVNEQMQYYYNQTIFVNERYELEAEAVPPIDVNFHDNKQTLDNLLSKPEGLFLLIDEATKNALDYDSITSKLLERKSQLVKRVSDSEVSVAHYTGRVTYDIRTFVDENRDFVPPEMIESLRTSLDETIVLMFTNQLSKCGNLTMDFEIDETKEKEKPRTYKLNVLSQGVYSQIGSSRTISAVFRSACLELLRTIAGTDSAGTHFVRCIRADLDFKPRNFHPDMVQQQIKALGVIETIMERQKGYSCRISFQEFLSRYQFLAFDFDETVDVTKDNCRLLLIRLKMEGWAIGKSKVFLRYYNDEFLARLYEIQVKKIIKVQSMMRSYIARRKMKQGGGAPISKLSVHKQSSKDADQAALQIQKVYRGFKIRQKYGPLLNDKTGKIDNETAGFIKSFAKKWKMKSIYQVLLHYRAARFMDLVNFSQQVHLYNQRVIMGLMQISKGVPLDKVDPKQTNPSAFGRLPMPVRKLPFRLNEIPFFDTTYMLDPVTAATVGGGAVNEEDPWDLPMQKHPSLTQYLMTYNAFKKEQSCQTNWDRMYDSDVVYNQTYSRDPNFIRRSTSANANRSSDFLSNPNYSSMDLRSRSNPPPASRYNQFTNDNIYSTSPRPGSRRSSIKKYAAPSPPPPMMMNSNEQTPSWMKRQQTNENIIKRDFRPPNPVQELEMMGRRAGFNSENDTGDDPPFNFRAMLRKTNYNRVDNNNVEFESKTTFMPKLRPTGQKLAEPTRIDINYNKVSTSEVSNINDTNAGSFAEAGTYIEEEIAPGVTLSGYAVNI